MPSRPVVILVTGAAGFIGRRVLEELSKSGLPTRACDLLGIPPVPHVETTRADIGDEHALSTVTKDVEVVLHMASHPLAASIAEPLATMHVNVCSTVSLLEAMRRSSCNRIIFTSASSVIGRPLYNPVDEVHPCSPKTPYTVSKLAIEQLLRVYSEIYGMRYLVFRLFNVYGPGQSAKSGGIIPIIFHHILKGQPVTIYGDGTAQRDFVFVSDVVHVLKEALRRTDLYNRILNVGTGLPTSVNELVKTIAGILRQEFRATYKPEGKGEIGNFYASTENLRTALGFVPKIGLTKGLEMTASAYGVRG